jgi:sugar lactone lactonase YvrE
MDVTLSVLSAGLDHPEGVAWHPDGWVVAGGSQGQLYRVEPETGKSAVIARSGGVLRGLAVGGRGEIYACDVDRRAVLSRRSGVFEVVSTGTLDRPLVAPNYPVLDEAGYLYVSDSGTFGGNDGAILIVSPEGGSVWHGESDLPFPNGLAIDPPGLYLYVAESTLPGISRWWLGTAGSFGIREVFTRLPGYVPDGLAFCADGRLLVMCYEPDVILLIDDLNVSIVADGGAGSPLAAPTNLAYMGSSGRAAIANLRGTHLTVADGLPPGAALRYPERPTERGHA